MLSSFTIDPLVPYLQVAAARLDFSPEIYIAPFDTIHQELLDPDSGCLRHRPDVVFIAQDLAATCPELTDEFLEGSAEAVDRAISGIICQLKASIATFRRRSAAALVVHNFALSCDSLLGAHEAMAPQSQTDAIRQLNRRLVDAVRTVPGAYVLDYDRVAGRAGYRNARDERFWHLARAPLSAIALRELAHEQAAFVHALFAPPRKCLVLDLDNTLWGGVVGEVGTDGVALGSTYPGSAFRQFQIAIRHLNRRGILLAVNSKNNLEDAEQALRSHPGMVLRPADFAATRINWRDKPQNMIELADELNIGLDSLVFVDDDPAERAKMRQVLPAVFTVEMPADPTGYAAALLGSRVFDRLSLTPEDRRRTAMYREERAREVSRQSASSVEDFLRTLEMKVAIQPVDASTLPRVVDLLRKTNQFNLTTRRHPAPVVAEMMEDPRHGVFCLHASDRFGDHGIVGVAIVERAGGICRVDSLLMSCRVIGRSVETAFLSYIASWADAHGATALEGEFVPSSRNAPAADFYPRHGFRQVNHGGTVELWSLSLQDHSVAWPEYIGGAGKVEQLT